MRHRIFIPIFLVLALCCASANAATPGVAIDTPDVQIGDWEQSMDGWSSWLGTDSFSTIGVTSGSWSLRHNKGALGWNPMLAVAVDPDAFFGNSVFSIDAASGSLTASAADSVSTATRSVGYHREL